MKQLARNSNMDIEKGSTAFDYSKRAKWLRAAVLGANDGLISTASLMMGVGAVKHDVKAMILSGIAGMVAGACSMAIGEFVSVFSHSLSTSSGGCVCDCVFRRCDYAVFGGCLRFYGDIIRNFNRIT